MLLSVKHCIQMQRTLVLICFSVTAVILRAENTKAVAVVLDQPIMLEQIESPISAINKAMQELNTEEFAVWICQRRARSMLEIVECKLYEDFASSMRIEPKKEQVRAVLEEMREHKRLIRAQSDEFMTQKLEETKEKLAKEGLSKAREEQLLRINSTLLRVFIRRWCAASVVFGMRSQYLVDALGAYA